MSDLNNPPSTNPKYRQNPPPNLGLNLGHPLSASFTDDHDDEVERSGPAGAVDYGHVRTPPRAAAAAVSGQTGGLGGQVGRRGLEEEEEEEERTPVGPNFMRGGGDFVGSGPQVGRGREPSIDETHPSFDYQPHPSYSTLHATPSRTQLINPSTGGTSTTLNGGGPDDSQTYLHRTLTDESMHSREPLNFTPRMESGGTPEMNSNPYASSSQGYAGSSIRPVKETDYGKVATGAGAGAGTTYPPGQYTSIPLNDGGMGEKQEMGSERGRKKGIAWGGADRWSRNGTKEAATDLGPHHGSQDDPNMNSLSSRGSRPHSRSRPSSIFRGAFGGMAGTGGTGASTPRSEWEGFEFNPATARKEELRYAEGDVGKSKFARGYFYLLNKSIITRWFLYIFPVLVLLWIPGIVWLAGARGAKIWSTNLLYWSIWLTVVWGGWWAAVAVGMTVPKILQATLVAIVPSMRQWIQIFSSLTRNVALILWTLAMWVSFTPLIINHYTGNQEASSRSTLSLIANLLFGLFLSSLVIGGEKLIVQLIAYRFHQDSYEDRIRDQKLQIRSLVTLYINSTDIPGRRDTLTEADMLRKSKDPKKHIRKALKGLKSAAQTTTTALGNVATEISGQSVLQTNSPYNRVTAALASANKSKALARRLYYSFRREGNDVVLLRDIARFFPDQEAAEVAFAVFDRDENGDATRDEFDMACIQIHREKLALEASMRDLDGAVRRLDDIFMVIVLVIVVLIMAAMVTTKLTTLVTSAGTFVLGLSWLIGTTMQEILGACIFLFVKHPFDVGDRVDFDGQSYVVASMQLMSTTFRRVDGAYTYIGNDILRAKLIQNIRRSGAISESFMFEVDFATDFKKLVELRDKMLMFLGENRRDYMPVFDVVVDSFPEQGKLILKADIKYKTNWQEGALKVQRRNKWICALKNALADCHVYGPAGAGDPAPAPADPIAYTMVPYVAPAPNSEDRSLESPPPDFLAATTGAEHGAALLDQREVVNDASGDIFDDQVELHDTNSGFTTTASNTPGAAALRQRRVPGEDLEHQSRHRA